MKSTMSKRFNPTTLWKTSAAVVVVIALGFLESTLVAGFDWALLYLPPVAAVGWIVGSLPGLMVGLAAGIVRWFLGLGTVGALLSPTVLLAAVGAAVGYIERDRRNTKRFRQFVHGLLERQAETVRRDPLTDITNRRGFFEQLHVEFARWERGGPPFGVIYVDLDNFKQVNDRYGHEQGDRLLRDVAQAIKRNVKETDVPARIGGDEFVILCWNAGPEALRKVADRLHQRMQEVGSDYADVDFGLSLGVACFQEPPENADDVVRWADAAMYKAKHSAGEPVVLWQPRDSFGPGARPEEYVDSPHGRHFDGRSEPIVETDRPPKAGGAH